MSGLWSYFMVTICLVYGLEDHVDVSGTSGPSQETSTSNWTTTSNNTEYYGSGDVDTTTHEPQYFPSSTSFTSSVDLNGLPQSNETVQFTRPSQETSSSNWSTTSNNTEHYGSGDVNTVTHEPQYLPSSTSFTSSVDLNGLPQSNETVQFTRQCRVPSSNNWTIERNDTEYFIIGDVVTVICEPRSRPSPPNITCVEMNGTAQWNESVQCLRQCGKPSASNLSIITNDKEFYDIDEVLTVRCKHGFRPASTNITCEDLNGLPQWNKTVQCIRLCAPPSVKNLIITGPIKPYYDVGDVVTVSCDTGYHPSSDHIVCEDHNGTLQWNVTPLCSGQCREPVAKHLNVTGSGTSYYNIGHVYKLQCDRGYRPSSKNILCENKNGTVHWNVTPLCLPQCEKPEIINISQLSENKDYYNVNESIEVTCVEGYWPTYRKMICARNGDELKWDRHSQCIAQCKKPEIINVRQLSEDKDYYNVSESVKVTCAKGFWPSHRKMTCKRKENELKWDHHSQCIAQCKKPEIINVSQLSKDKDYYNVNESINVTCMEGFWPLHRKMTCVKKRYELKWDHHFQCIGIKLTDWSVTSTSISFNILCTPQCPQDWTFTAGYDLMHEIDTSWNASDNKSVKFTNLQPFSKYTINTTLCISNKSYFLGMMTIRTNESVPDRPIIKQNLTMEDNTITWELSDIRGKVTGFQMNISAWRDYNVSFHKNETLWFLRNMTEYKIPLQHGTNYRVTLQGFTSVGAGNVTALVTETEIGAPPSHVEKTLNNSILHLFPVEDLYGPISSYEIIVVDGEEHNLSTTCRTLKNIHYNSSTTSGYYTAAVFSARDLTGPRNFTLGDDEHYNGFYNAPLTPKNTYTIYIRVNSQWKQVNKSSCAFSGFLEVAETKSNTVQIIAGSIAAVILLLVLLILVVVWRCRSSCKSSRSSDIPLKTQIGPGKKKDIPVDNLLDIVKKFRILETADTNDEDENSAILCVGRYHEYQELPSGWMYPCTVALSQENQAKNRYKKVLPYDDSRVVLRSSQSTSDYINASYVDGYKAPRCYIATQGPIPETVSDFWSMVWQENSSVIVMLTGLEEQNKVKCERYWPEQSQTYGDITVCVRKIVQTGAFTIRSFSLKKVQSTVQMTVEQIHYLRWPDHGVPKNTSDMVQLIELMNKWNPPGSGPVIVHCSAGIGRTGTFLALDILLKRAHAVKKVNVYNCVLELRKKRVKMVQEKEQYIFLYDVLVETLLCGSTSVPVAEIQKHTCCMYVADPTTHRNGFDKEFQALEKITELYRIYPCKEGKKVENQTKNYNPDILPGDHWRPILLSSLTRYGAPGYINAVFVNSNSQNDALIVTQLPMKHTQSDFWALVWDYKCTVVVMMQGAQDLQENASRFWPEEGETAYGAFKVRATEKNPRNGYTASTLNLRRSKGPYKDSLEVKLLELDSWPMEQSLPESPAALISMVVEAEKCQLQTTGSHILVTCCDGAGRSGLFCAGVIICDQIRSDGCLDVSQAVRSLRRRRHQFIPTVEQYTFCYSLAQGYLDSFETYGNFI